MIRPPSDPPIHVVLGDAAAEVLQAATRDHGLPGTVHVIPDDLGHGPLDDGIARVAYMRRCYQRCFAWTHTVTDAFEPWRDLARLDGRDGEVVVWQGRNVSETVLLMIAVDALPALARRLFVVELPDDPNSGRSHLGTRTPTEIVGLYPLRRNLTDAEAADHRALLAAFRAGASERRRWVDGRVLAVPTSTFDGLLLDATSQGWQPAARVVAQAMTAADPRDGLSDVFLGSRLIALLDQGTLASDRQPEALASFSVRRTGKSD